MNIARRVAYFLSCGPRCERGGVFCHERSGFVLGTDYFQQWPTSSVPDYFLLVCTATEAIPTLAKAGRHPALATFLPGIPGLGYSTCGGTRFLHTPPAPTWPDMRTYLRILFAPIAYTSFLLSRFSVKQTATHERRCQPHNIHISHCACNATSSSSSRTRSVAHVFEAVTPLPRFATPVFSSC